MFWCAGSCGWWKGANSLAASSNLRATNHFGARGSGRVGGDVAGHGLSSGATRCLRSGRMGNRHLRARGMRTGGGEVSARRLGARRLGTKRGVTT